MFISVIMAVYNGDEYLKESIESILNQTYKEFEFIIVNDGSTDGTKEILDSIYDKRIKVIHLTKNQGVSNARNLAIEHAKGDWIAIQDDDDISLPHRLEEQLKYIQSHQDVVAVCSFIEGIAGNITVDQETLQASANYHNRYRTREEIENARLGNCPVCCGTAMFSKKVFFEVGKYDTSLRVGEDYDLILLKMFDIGKVEIIPKVLYQYRADPKSVTRQNRMQASNLINVVSLRGIRRICYSHLTKKPSVIILGTSTVCDNFSKNIAPFIDFHVYKYENVRISNKKVVSLIKKRIIDGIILLNGDFGIYKNYYIEKHVIVYNKNLFVIWNELR